MRRTALAWWIAAAVAVVAAIVVLSQIGARPKVEGPWTPQPAAGPARASDFADSIGVNVHLTYGDTPYGNFPRVLSSLRTLGVRHIRDGLVPNRPDQYEHLNQLHLAGIRSTLIMGAPNLTRLPALVDTLKRDLSQAVDAVEGPNEYDVSDDPDWDNALRRYQRQLYAAVKKDPALRDITVYGPTIVDPAKRAVLGDVEHAMDAANIHPYPAGGPPEPALGREVAYATRMLGQSAVVATETGYHNATSSEQGQPPVDEAIAADYLPRVFLSAFADGIRRTYWYELVDVFADEPRRKPDANFGLLRHDFTPKPAYDALANLLALVDDERGAHAPSRPFDVTIPAPSRQVRRVLLQKGDGVYLLALWREAQLARGARRALDERPLELRIELPRRVAEVALYRPSRSARPVDRFHGVTEVPVSLAGDAVVAELTLGSP